MTEKVRGLSYFWHTDQELDEQQPANEAFDYSGIDSGTISLFPSAQRPSPQLAGKIIW